MRQAKWRGPSESRFDKATFDARALPPAQNEYAYTTGRESTREPADPANARQARERIAGW
jgi:hypothetical protein